MRRTLLPLGCLLFADLAAAADLSGRAILSYQDFEAETLSSDSFFRSYDLRFERRPIDPLRFRIGIRADQRDGSVDAGAGPTGQDFSQLQPNAELLYALSTFQLQGNYDRIRSRVLVDAGPERERFLERWTGQLSWRPEGLPGLSLQSERRNVQDLSAQIDRIETLFQGTLDYRFKGLMASAITRRQDLDDERAVFARKSRQNEGLLGYDSSLAGGRVSASASLLVSNTHLDEQARAGAVSVPTPVPITRALFAVDDTPGESRDQPPSPVPALIDGNLERGTGLQFGPDGASYQNLSLDLGRPQTLDAFRLHVRDVEGKLVPIGGPITWDIYTSPDGERWTLIAAAATNGFVTALSAYEIRFPAATSRYFKLVNFGLDSVQAEATELQAFRFSDFAAGETRRTDIDLQSGTATLSVRPVDKLTLTYYGLYNNQRQTSEARPELTSESIEHLASAESDVGRFLNLRAQYQNRTLDQNNGYRQTFDEYAGFARFTFVPALQQTLELTTSEERSPGRTTAVDGVTLRTYSRFYPNLDLTLDVGLQRQDYTLEASGGALAIPLRVDRRFLSGVSQAQLTSSLKLTLTGTLQHSVYDASLGALGSGTEGLPPERDNRWTAELYYRPSPQLSVAARVGHAAAAGVSGTLQRYHVDWYPFPGGSVRLGGTYDHDFDSVAHRQARRLTLTPAWTLNRHTLLDLNYTRLEFVGAQAANTRTFFATLTLTL